MIISRTPLRMSFVGGGSDLPSYYRQHGGAVLSTAVDKYVYVSVNKKFDGGIRIAYSKTEEVDHIEKIEHRLVHATLQMLEIQGGIEVTSTADIPSRGTGLGSSSAFTVGLINVLSAYLGRHVSAEQLGRLSCEIEIERCNEPIGKQDQYASAYGGLSLIEFKPDDSVLVTPLVLQRKIREAIESSIVVFYTGITRSASGILKEQSSNVADSASKQKMLSRMVELVYELRDELQSGHLDSMGEILDENWRLKKQLASGITSSAIDDWYVKAKANGALGGKLLGAGAGGFLMFYAPPERHDAIEKALGLRRINFGFEPLGSRIIFYNPTDL
ncbi:MULTISPECIES: GHMP kinase [unclassified Variovorax]|uniref:GHMP family kinase ATP-binding protein n=1 Tax=unclassified Variovorax TaxID=663243 RepID=UPI0008C93488|nr:MULTISPECIES: GHMP kinase [unclassified Variovorax]SEI92677.1 D-glycero-alpha-D-manno-heptose-7-phosphate kinase [Variovorax sp. OK202]SFB84473.1 D-glycero-alpha-D-manno-heptose-7-phosphate kinase [Variovorax sp. OK212]